jgi:hypothetical protein
LDIEPGEPVGVYHFFTGSEDDGDQVALTVLSVENFEAEVDMDAEHAEKDELEDYRRMTSEEIMEENTTETLKQMLRERIF